MRAFAPFYREAMQAAIQDSGAPDNWFGLSLACGSHPQPFTVERYHTLFPYTAPERFTEILEGLARLELLERVGRGGLPAYRSGAQSIQGIFEAAHQGLDTIEPLPAGEMDQINSLLYRIVEATLAAPEPEEKWAIAYSRWTDPGAGASGSVKTDQYLTDLLRYRTTPTSPPGSPTASAVTPGKRSPLSGAARPAPPRNWSKSCLSVLTRSRTTKKH